MQEAEVVVQENFMPITSAYYQRWDSHYDLSIRKQAQDWNNYIS